MSHSDDPWPILDDVGSFPLPDYISKDLFDKFYWDAYLASVNSYDFASNRALWVNIVNPIQKSFESKISSGIEVANYPQHMDMYTQFLKPIKEFSVENEPHLIQQEKAKMIEINILEKWAKWYFEKTGQKTRLKICVSGPLELYFKEVGFGVYSDMALNFSKSVNFFLKNAILDTKFIKTEIVAIDEPSLGYVTITGAEPDDLIKIYDASVEGIRADVQIHLHSLNMFKVPLQTKNIKVFTCEFASNPQNFIDKKYLDEYDKFIRVGITRTNFNAIMADALEAGTEYKDYKSIEGLQSLIDSPERIEKTFKTALAHYGDRLKYVGPDCGLSAWGPPPLATELLRRTSDVVRANRKK